MGRQKGGPIIFNMFKFTIICLGKLKESAYRELENEFRKRLSPFARVNIIELAEISYRDETEIEKVKQKESLLIKNRIPKDGYVVALKESGELKNSHTFAEFLNSKGSNGVEIVFIIGSGVGLHESVFDYSDTTISLSPLTFPHNMARILLEEQLYRAVTILNGKKYHK